MFRVIAGMARETSEHLLPPPVQPDPASSRTCVRFDAVSALFRSWPLPYAPVSVQEQPPCPAAQVAAQRARGSRCLCLRWVCGSPAPGLQLASWKWRARLCQLSCKLRQDWPIPVTISFQASWDLAAYVLASGAVTYGRIRRKPKPRRKRRRCRRR